MELEELKATWRQHAAQQATAHALQADQLRQLLREKARKNLRSINRKMLADACLMTATLVGCVAFSFAIGLQERVSIAIMMGIVFAGLLLHYRIKHRLLNRMDLSSHSLLAAVQKLAGTLDGYLRAYAVAVPGLVSAMYLWLLARLHPTPPTDWPPMLWAKAAMVVPLALLGYWGTKRLSHYLYGKELARLKECYKALVDL